MCDYVLEYSRKKLLQVKYDYLAEQQVLSSEIIEYVRGLIMY